MKRTLFSFMMMGCLAMVVFGCSSGTDIEAPEVNLQNIPPERIVFEAASAGDVDMLETILSSDPTQANAVLEDGSTPLHYAASRGQDDAVDVLLNSGANPAALDENSETPADVARQNAHVDLAKRLQALITGG